MATRPKMPFVRAESALGGVSGEGVAMLSPYGAYAPPQGRNSEENGQASGLTCLGSGFAPRAPTARRNHGGSAAPAG